ncbi:hypothetical protein [Confluentibacter sediminis]|uniref:hypothetical protein n=1 Tax=Confluentibacter sediminis TaxID=2219045 RepID=UPI0013A6E421|nr:hypothetical protein [Confluentibacter sediminis]
MMNILSIIERPLHHYRQWDFIIFTLLTLLSVLNGQTTVFYLIYFFWCNELLCLVVDRLCYKRNSNALYENVHSVNFGGGLFLMGIYWVFLVVFFGFIAASDNTEIMITNMQVLFFHNWFFNINLIFVLLERVYLHKKQQPIKVCFGAFSPNIIVLHISIVVGGMLIFFVIKRYPEVFTPENPWGSVVIALPFLFLKMGMQYLTSSNNKTTKQNYN